MIFVLLPAIPSACTSALDLTRINALVLANLHNPFARCHHVLVLRKFSSFCLAYGLDFVSHDVYAFSTFVSGNGSKSSSSVNDESTASFVSALAIEMMSPRREEKDDAEREEDKQGLRI